MKFFGVLAGALLMCAFVQYVFAIPVANEEAAASSSAINPQDAEMLPMMNNITQKLLDQLEQYSNSGLFFGNPCSFFQQAFRTVYCSISATDPQRQNPIVQSFLQFLNTNQMFFNFFSSFFCSFGNMGGGGGNNGNSGGLPSIPGIPGIPGIGGGGGGGNSQQSGAINCASGNGAAGNVNLDEPTAFDTNTN